MHSGGCFSAEMHVMQAIVRPFNYAIVDEADSVLIDDCMTPLVLSAASDTVSKEQYILAHKVRLPTVKLLLAVSLMYII